ncbi:hypothetical protein E1287_21135 [Actinomadura sp. KC06]|uniref:hypothetical protein n=1 Tax=Actinomadura sp. KC06 TaxID=2530369 RepID=UPI00104666C0|nr:hypothetical protein [Actinomadura sp. KC06]TDD32909.1 hypothetical protein E1287_21135 [Actinomadura sp. KC06]
MNTLLVRIALPKLFLWSEAARFQEYPEAAARAEPGHVYSRADLERVVFDIAPTMEFKGGAPRGKGTDGVINTYGMERSGARYRINGISLFERVDKGLRATAEGVALGKAYREADTDVDWARALAKQLLRRDPRTRLVIGLCLADWQLGVEAPGGIPTGALSLTSPEGDVLEIAQRNCDGFNMLLRDNAELALGPCWRADLSVLGETTAVVWEGVQGGTPSTNDLPTALKKALAVFFHIRAFDGGPSTWRLGAGGLADALAVENLVELGFEGAVPVRLTDDEAFARALRDCSDAEGFLIVSQLGERFGELLQVPNEDRAAILDSYIRTAMYHDQLRVLDRHSGQPRMGRGLFGESGSRRVRIEFTPIPKTTNAVAEAQTPAGSSSEMQGADR